MRVVTNQEILVDIYKNIKNLCTDKVRDNNYNLNKETFRFSDFNFISKGLFKSCS